MVSVLRSPVAVRCGSDHRTTICYRNHNILGNECVTSTTSAETRQTARAAEWAVERCVQRGAGDATRSQRTRTNVSRETSGAPSWRSASAPCFMPSPPSALEEGADGKNVPDSAETARSAEVLDAPGEARLAATRHYIMKGFPVRMQLGENLRIRRFLALSATRGCKEGALKTSSPMGTGSRRRSRPERGARANASRETSGRGERDSG